MIIRRDLIISPVMLSRLPKLFRCYSVSLSIGMGITLSDLYLGRVGIQSPTIPFDMKPADEP